MAREQVTVTTTAGVALVLDLSHNPQGAPLPAGSAVLLITDGRGRIELAGPVAELRRALHLLVEALAW